MANSKARSKRPAPAQGGRSSAAASTRSARTAAAVSATPNSSKATRPAPRAAASEPVPDLPVQQQQPPRPSEQPLWLQVTSLVLAVLGLAISVYETWAHYNGNHLAGCPTGGAGGWDCTAVITSKYSMVFHVFPVAVLGLAFYLVAVPLFSPWGWRVDRLSLWGWQISRRTVDRLRLASVIVGMGFVMYLIYGELEVNAFCEYCTGVHIVTFLLFCITVFSAAIWGLGERREAPGRRG
jgi:uncharacterized membrane protein